MTTLGTIFKIDIAMNSDCDEIHYIYFSKSVILQ